MTCTRQATLDELDRCAAVLGEAFADYPWTKWTVDAENHAARVASLQRLALEHYGFPFGEVWVTLVDDAIACVAVWMDSASPVPPQTEVAAQTAELEGRRHEASVLAEKDIAALRPPQRHLYLATIGTSPAHQRRGLATATLAPKLAAADARGVPCYLETSAASNVAFYERLGFTATAHVRIADHGPELWAMLRTPRSASEH